jgi:hypothetical protein
MKKQKKDKESYPPKRGRKMIQLLHELVDMLEYYMDRDSKGFKEHVLRERAIPIEDYIHEISIDKNIDHIRFAKKLKAMERAKIMKEQEANKDD